MNVDSLENKAKNSLWESIFAGKDAIAKKLIDEIKIPINESLTETGTKPLHQAILSGRDNLAKELVEKYKADVNARDNDLRTPLHFAAARRNKELIDFLISKGAEVDAQTIVKLQIEQTILNKPKGGETPAMKACMAGDVSCINELILVHKSNVNIANTRGKTVFDFYIIYIGKQECEEFIEKLCSLGIADKSTILRNQTVLKETVNEEQKEQNEDFSANGTHKNKPGHIKALVRNWLPQSNTINFLAMNDLLGK